MALSEVFEFLTSIISPDAETNGNLRVVGKQESLLGELLSGLSLDVLCLSNSNDYTEQVDGLDLDELFNLGDLGEVKSNFLDGAVVHTRLDLGLSAEIDAEVVVVRCEPFVCKLDHAFTKCVHSVFFDLGAPILGVFVEEGGFDRSAVAVQKL